MKFPKNDTRYSDRRFKSCLKKKAYKTTEELRQAGKRLEEYYGGSVSVHGYWCRYCHKFHLTTKEYSSEELRRKDEMIF